MCNVRAFAALALLSFAAALPALSATAGDDFDWSLPKGFPKPRVPADNPMTAAKVELGRNLFYDTRLSVNGKQSCGSCHQQALAFTDGKPIGIGATGEKHPRGAMSLVNVAYAQVLTWSNPRIKSLEEQALVPMFGEHPVELGLREGDGFLDRLHSDPHYRYLFQGAFPGEKDPFTVANVCKAIACFERIMISGYSPWDRYHYDRDDAAISESAKRGEILFFSQPLSCFRCHGGFNFGGGPDFHNNGLAAGPNEGILEFTRDPADRGKFKAPTLRNIALTAPYMHDGSIATLDAVLDHYAGGGRGNSDGRHPDKDPLIGGFRLSSADRADLIEFLKSLTDETILHTRRLANPWSNRPTR